MPDILFNHVVIACTDSKCSPMFGWTSHAAISFFEMIKSQQIVEFIFLCLFQPLLSFESWIQNLGRKMRLVRSVSPNPLWRSEDRRTRVSQIALYFSVSLPPFLPYQAWLALSDRRFYLLCIFIRWWIPLSQSTLAIFIIACGRLNVVLTKYMLFSSSFVLLRRVWLRPSVRR